MSPIVHGVGGVCQSTAVVDATASVYASAMQIGDAESRQLIMEPSSVELWILAMGLSREGELFPGGVSTARVADILELGEVENWPRTARETRNETELFRPFAIIPGDSGTKRSFLPEDVEQEEEGQLRAFAESSKNQFVRARVFEVLWSRFERFPDAKAAIDARFACTQLADAEENWPGMVRNLGRLTTLLRRLNATARLPDLVSVLDRAASELLACSRPFAFAVLADMVCNTLLTKNEGRAAFTDARGQAWRLNLGQVAKRYDGDSHHGHDALVVLQAWRGRWGDQEGATSTRREIVAHLLKIAKAASPDVAPTFAQQALQAALDFGLPDLADSLRMDLAQTIRNAVPTFRQISGSFTLPPELVKTVDEMIVRSPSRAVAVRRLGLLPGLLEVDSAKLRESARAQLGESPFYAMVPKVRYDPDGKITHRADTPEESVNWQVSMLVGFHLATVEAVLGHFLRQSFAEFSPLTLMESLSGWPHLHPGRHALLGASSERFHAQDWISSGCLVAIAYEAMLRDLLRAGGYAALKLEPGGVQKDETLNSLIRSEAAKTVLGEPHCAMVEYVLCEPGLGWNLRNDVAHGTIGVGELTPARVLLLWLLTARVTCFVFAAAEPKAEGPGEQEPEGFSGTSATDEG